MARKEIKKIRYCSECGMVGAVPERKLDCCALSQPIHVPHDVAIQAHAGFQAALALHEAKITVSGR